MLMPKAAVNKNYRVVFLENDIRFAGQAFDVFSESIPETVQK